MSEKAMKQTKQENADSFIRVALKANNGQYVSVGSSGNAPLQAARSSIGQGETFEMLHQGEWQVAFRAANGKFVGSDKDENNQLAANSNKMGKGEIFRIVPLDEKHVALIATNGSYVCNAKSGAAPLRATSKSAGDSETFELVPLEKDKVESPARPSARMQNRRAAHIQSAAPSVAFTVFFAGTACTRDEGEVSRPESDKRIYCEQTGYILVRLHKEISGDLRATRPSVTVRGVGENDWSIPRHDSEPLVFKAPLKADKTLLSYIKSYSGGDQLSKATQLDGWSAPALALHGANLAAASGARQFNFFGHSRGAVEAIMAAWFLYAYGSDSIRQIPVNIFAIDPVPGTGEWYGILTQLPPNVMNYVGVYSWDQCVMPADKPFSALVPRPNGRMIGTNNDIKLTYYRFWPWNRWKYLADESQKKDPLKPAKDPQPQGYELFACRGRHSTVAGNATANAEYDPTNVSADVESVPKLVYRMARAYLTKWGVEFPRNGAVDTSALDLRIDINLNHRLFDIMGGGATRTSILADRPYVRRVSSIYGKNPFNTYFMDDVAGDPPYTMAYPVTNERKNAGWVKWKFL
ncbi:MAG: hypothetical protein H6942_15825 [Candidatus Accumulibacter sp.]|uniref:fascin domain-containing protein n=2 Tax=Accumulibacter sp. TaxID=2053492 RepID=UPI0025F09E55|nr:hypothetical protein [Accumulibacter sp.]MCP5249977.1 hypothetical protein [Accumulibacter sp.]